MTYTKKQFLEDVKKEAVALKKHATKGELAKLDFENLSPRHIDRCIYGQLGDGCRSERSVELIKKCCKITFGNNVLGAIVEAADDGNVRGINKVIVESANGSASKIDASLSLVSSIEVYIYLPNAKNKNLIDFLKGNRKDLVL